MNMRKLLLGFLVTAFIPSTWAANVSVVPRGGGERQDSVQPAPAPQAAPAPVSRGNTQVVPRGGGGGGNYHGSSNTSVRPAPVRVQPRSVTESQYYGNMGTPRQTTTVVPRSHGEVAGNVSVVRRIGSNSHQDVTPNRYYWHTVNGRRYAHYYDRHVHWYGFYDGPSFYWTRYYGGYWWWFDVRYNRWAYWHNDYWWAPGPAGVVYVNVNDQYIPYQQGVVPVTPPSDPVVPVDKSAEKPQGSTFNSPDKTRMVQVFGPDAEGFLYKTSGDLSVFLKYLGKNVEKVRFSGGEADQPLRLLIDFKDGKFALFDAEGVEVKQ
jgi:hypothetical protein